MLKHAFIQRVYKIPTKRNTYGDIVYDYGAETIPLMCRFRYIAETNSVNNREEDRSNLVQIWFSPNSGITFNDIVKYEDRYWQIVGLTEARRLRSSRIEFLKCVATAYDIIS